MAVGNRKHHLSVVHFVPLIGDSCCGSNTGVERRFFGGYRRFFAPVKEMGVHYKRNPSTIFDGPPPFNKGGYPSGKADKKSVPFGTLFIRSVSLIF